MQLHRKDYMPRYMQRKEHPGMQQTRDLDYLEMLEKEDHMAAKSGGGPVQLAAPVVQRQALQGVVQREPDMQEAQTALPEETREEFAAIVLSEENLEIASLFEMYREITRDVQTIHGVITDVIGAQKNRERRLAQALGREKYYRYGEGRSEGRRFGSFWKGLQNSVFDTRQMFLELISYFGQASAVPTFSLGTWYYFSQLREDTHAETREYYRAYAEPILHHLRGKDAAYQLGYLVEIEEGAALGRMTGFVLETLLTELVGAAFLSLGGRLLRLSDLQSVSLEAVISSSRRLRMGRITEGARALEKKLGHARSGGYTSAFAGIEPSQNAAEQLIRGILRAPARMARGAKTLDVYNSKGQGIRILIETNEFLGFLELKLLSR